jgi:ankyrin repeat protein
MACKLEAVETVKMLLEHGADPNVKVGDRQETALWHVCASHDFTSKSAEIATLLLDAGADPTHQVKGHSVLVQAILFGNKPFVKALLATKKLDLNSVDKKGNSPLDFAILCNSKSIVQMLVSAGATPHKMKGHRLTKQLNFSVKKKK